jgi:hypothetical protein
MSTSISQTVARFALAVVAAAWSSGCVAAGVEEPKPATTAAKESAAADQVGKLVRQLGDKN